MNTLFTEILDMSVTASFMIAAILLIRPLTAKVSKNINCILWALAGLRLVLPFSFKSKVSAVPDLKSLTPEIAPAITPEVIPEAAPTLPSEPVTQSGSIEILSVLWIVWLCGIALLVIYTAISFMLIKRKTAISLHETDNVYICDGIKGAFILGSFKPRIYIPSDTPEEQKQHVIAHENAHIKRLDYLWKPLALFVAILHWFNPLVWVGYILLCRDIELACDEAVTRNMTVDSKKSYTRALLECAVAGNRYRPSPLAFGEVGVKDRIKSILNYRKPAFWVSFGVMAVCVIVTVVFMTDPVINAKIPDPLPEISTTDTEEIKEPEPPETEEIPEDTETKSTEAAETEPVETEPVETEPEETEPEETEPEETEPEETEPEETESVETEPKETESKETEAKETGSKETKPKETEPTETKPVETKPADTTAAKPEEKPEPVVTHTVTFVANGGYCEKTSETVTHGQASVTLPMPTKAGYIFEGWWDADEGGTRIRSNTVCTTADTVLYARWRDNSTVKVTLMYDGKTEMMQMTKGDSFGTLFTPIKEGHTFDGWYINGTQRLTPDTVVPDHDIYLEARWIEN